MNRHANTNRTPWIVYGAIALLAIIVRILSPSAAPSPGPKGEIPNWTSTSAIGTMGPWAVNPSGTMWAGAWNEKAEDGKVASAVWIVDFEKQESRRYIPKGSGQIDEIRWADNKKLLVNGGAKHRVSLVDAVAAKQLKADYAFPTPGMVTPPELIVSADNRSYSYSAPGTDAPKLAFTSDDLPGAVAATWTSPTQALVLCRSMDKFSEVVYDFKTAKLSEVGKDGFTTDVKANWPDAPRDMLFVTYRGGFGYDLAKNKTKKLFDYKSLEDEDDIWRTNIQDGRLYPRKDGGYTSVSFDGRTIDIRVLDKNGRLKSDLLPR